MADIFETPAEREARLSAQNARINEAIAEDVAVGMAAEAEAERERANAIARGNINLQREAEAARFNSIYSQNEAVEAKRDANNSKFGFWLLASILAASLLFGSMWMANRANDTDTAVSASQPPVINRTVVVSPAPSATPAVIREYVPVPVPAQPVTVVEPAPEPVRGYVEPAAPKPAPSLAAPAPAATEAPVTQPASSEQPLSGYIEK